MKKEKESLHYPLFTVKAPTKLLYQRKFKEGRIIFVILFFGVPCTLAFAKEEKVWGEGFISKWNRNKGHHQYSFS